MNRKRKIGTRNRRVPMVVIVLGLLLSVVSLTPWGLLTKGQAVATSFSGGATKARRAPAAPMTTIIVNSNHGGATGTANPPPANVCVLREAIKAANT